MRVKRFEDLIAWQKARDLTKQIYLLTRNSAFSRDFGLRGQKNNPLLITYLSLLSSHCSLLNKKEYLCLIEDHKIRMWIGRSR